MNAYLSEGLSIAAINKPDQCVISGCKTALKALQETLEEQDISTSLLHINVAAHSPMVEPILADFGELLDTIQFQQPKIPIISNLTGDYIAAADIATSDYWLAPPPSNRSL